MKKNKLTKDKKSVRSDVKKICDHFDKSGVDAFKKFHKETEKTLRIFEEKSEKITRNSRIILAKVDKLFKRATKYEKGSTDLLQSLCRTFEKICSVHSQTEETLMNVLLAVRQNEYLQAWYPEQGRFPEMKVVGPHPMNVEKHLKNKKKNDVIR